MTAAVGARRFSVTKSVSSGIGFRLPDQCLFVDDNTVLIFADTLGAAFAGSGQAAIDLRFTYQIFLQDEPDDGLTVTIGLINRLVLKDKQGTELVEFPFDWTFAYEPHRTPYVFQSGKTGVSFDTSDIGSIHFLKRTRSIP